MLAECSPRSIESYAAALRSMRPAPRRTVHEWAEAERVIPRGTSPAAGRWKSRVYQRDVLEAVTDPRNTDGVLYVAASQRGGKTELLLNSIGYFIDSDPSPQILVTYSVDMAQKLSKHRAAPMIRESAALRGKVSEVRSRDSGNTILDKEYDGGQVTFVGANSAGGLSMSPKRVALFDEIDRYPPSAGTEGDPISLALKRLEAYWNQVKVFVTSPGIKDVSRSWRLWQQSDRREWHVECADCQTQQFLKWAQVQWSKDEKGRHLPETAVYACERCGSAWDDLARWRACDAGGYEPTADFTGLAGFRISALAISGVTLEKLVREWLSAQGNPEELKVFKTTVLCEWWEENYHQLDETGLMQRREPFALVGGLPEVPAPVALLTAGVDVQDNRLEASVYGWATREESWCLIHEVIPGDPSVSTTWDALDAWLLRPWPRAAGGVDFIRAAAVDTGGHHTQTSYDFCGARFRRPTPDGGLFYVFACKGTTGSGDLWPRQASKITTKVPLWPIRVDAGKEQIYGRLSLAKPGPGYIHLLENVDAKFCAGLTAEKVEKTLNKRTRKPQNIWKMKKAGGRNEPLDCAVYAYAALCGVRAMGFDFEAEVARLPERPVFAPREPQGRVKPPQAAPSQERRELGGDSWLGDTRNWLGR